ncbi:MAG: amino acid ABC transporter ATP-binding protein [Bacteroidia bacterium]|nr:amino acid ABC transporter ATP-binding protein [Bacteroidia bacterium]
MISVKHLSKIYYNGGKPLAVLRDVNCEIKKGEVISIIGPSGTGKSTFLRCLNLLESPTSGEIIIDGENILDKKTNIAVVRRKMGMVFQNFNLFNHLSILDNVTVGPVKLLGMSREEAESQAMELLRMVGLAEKAGAMPSDLSGGQKQRVAIARCLSMKPEIILFDEPTSALDPTMVGEVLSVIRQLAKQGMTMAIVTHEMQFAKDVSTRIFFMNEGVIYEEGAPDVIFNKPLKAATTAFINKIRGINIEIESRDCDMPGIFSAIDNFCMKYAIDGIVADRVKNVIRDMIAEVLPMDGKFTLHVDYSEKKDRVYVTFYYKNRQKEILSGDKVVASFEERVKPHCLTVHDDPDGENRLLRLKIRGRED